MFVSGHHPRWMCVCVRSINRYFFVVGQGSCRWITENKEAKSASVLDKTERTISVGGSYCDGIDMSGLLWPWTFGVVEGAFMRVCVWVAVWMCLWDVIQEDQLNGMWDKCIEDWGLCSREGPTCRMSVYIRIIYNKMGLITCIIGRMTVTCELGFRKGMEYILDWESS